MVKSGIAVAGLSVLLLGAAVPQVHAAPNLVQNGNFTSYTGSTTTGSDELNSSTGSTVSNGISLTNWTNTGYGYLFQPGTADTTGAPNREFGGTFNLWGPGSGGGSVANGLTAADPLAGAGGAFIGLDGDFQVGPLSQVVTGLTVGSEYYIGFDWAAAQQYGFNGATTDQFLVGIGSSVPTSTGQYQFATNVVSDPNHGFVPWAHVTFAFTANATSETLSFLSQGTPPGGVPPFALLDNVSVTYAPEPTTWAVMLAGLVALGFGGRFWRRGRSALNASAA